MYEFTRIIVDIHYIIQLTDHLQMSIPKKGKFSTLHFNKSVFVGSQTKNSTDRNEVSKTNISVITSVEDYRKNSAIKFGQQRYQQIKDSLEIEDFAKKNYQKRMKYNDNYVVYKKNPFLVKNGKLEEDELNETGNPNAQNLSANVDNTKKLTKRYENIIQGLINLKQKLEKNNIKAALPRPEQKVQQLSFKIQKEIKFADGKRGEKKGYEVDMSRFEGSHYTSEDKDAQKLPFQELEDIIRIKETNFYQMRTNTKEMNLFNVLYLKKNQRLLERGPKFLQKYSFCQDSLMKQKETKMSINPGDHISTKQRQQALNKQTQIPIIIKSAQEDLDLNLQKVKFEHLINVASTKIDSQNVLSYLSGLREVSMVKQNDQEIVYLKNQKHRKTIKDSQTNLNQEAAYLKQQVTTRDEMKQSELSQYYRKKLERILMNERKIITQCQIRDNKVVKIFEEEKSQVINQQMEALVSKEYREKDPEKLIRMSKLKKDRCLSIKNSIVLSTLINKRVYENASKSKSRSKSKTLNWR